MADFVEPFYVGGVPRHVKEVYDFIEKYNKEDLSPLDKKKYIGIKEPMISLMHKHFYVYKLIL